LLCLRAYNRSDLLTAGRGARAHGQLPSLASPRASCKRAPPLLITSQLPVNRWHEVIGARLSGAPGFRAPARSLHRDGARERGTLAQFDFRLAGRQAAPIARGLSQADVPWRASAACLCATPCLKPACANLRTLPGGRGQKIRSGSPEASIIAAAEQNRRRGTRVSKTWPRERHVLAAFRTILHQTCSVDHKLTH
jgi:hypothetical protein